MSKVYEYLKQFKEEGPQHPSEMGIEGHIRCKCGKFWGMEKFKWYCNRCKTKVIARGE